jgi:hypothetical protein
VYGVLILGHCRSCAEKKIISYNQVSEELIETKNHIEILISDLRRLSIKNQSLQNRRRMNSSDSSSERRALMTEEEYEEFLDKLGKQRDSDLAREYNVSDSYVCRTRQKLGIPTFANNEELWEKIDPIIFTRSIRSIAAEFEIDRGRVERRRKKLLQSQKQFVQV